MNVESNTHKWRIVAAVVTAILLAAVILIAVQIGRAQAAPRTPIRATRPAAVATTGSGQQSCTTTLYQRSCTRPTPMATRSRYDRRQQPQPNRPIYPTRRPTPRGE